MTKSNENCNTLLNVERYIFWSNKSEYELLINNFVEGKITSKEFEKNYMDMWRKDRDKCYDYEKYILKSTEFSKLLGEILSDCDCFDYELDEMSEKLDFQLDEKSFRNSMISKLEIIKNEFKC